MANIAIWVALLVVTLAATVVVIRLLTRWSGAAPRHPDGAVHTAQAQNLVVEAYHKSDGS